MKHWLLPFAPGAMEMPVGGSPIRASRPCFFHHLPAKAAPRAMTITASPLPARIPANGGLGRGLIPDETRCSGHPTRSFADRSGASGLRLFAESIREGCSNEKRDEGSPSSLSHCLTIPVSPYIHRDRDDFRRAIGGDADLQ